MVAVQAGLGKVRDRGSSLAASIAAEIVVFASSSSDGIEEMVVEIVEIESLWLWLWEKWAEEVEEGVVGGESMAGEEVQVQMSAGGSLGLNIWVGLW